MIPEGCGEKDNKEVTPSKVENEITTTDTKEQVVEVQNVLFSEVASPGNPAFW